MKKITREQILREVVPVPALEVQSQIGRKIEEWMATAGRLRTVVAEHAAGMDVLPASLMRRVFNGQL